MATHCLLFLLRQLKNKCPICSSHIGDKRNWTIENVLESLKVACMYAKYGCKEATSYSKRNEHQNTCIYAPCSCSHSGCDFIATCKELYFHCSKKHKDSAARFKYDSYFLMALNVRDKIIVLLEQKGGLFIVLNNKNVEQLGNVVNLSCIGSSLALRSFINNNPGSTIANESRAPKTKSLVIPSDSFYSCGSGQLKLKISSSACSKHFIV